MVVAIKSYRIFDRKGGENALFYWGYRRFGTFNFSDSKTVRKHSFTFYLQLVFEAKISVIMIIKKNERMNQMKITYREVNGYLIPNLKLPPEEASVRLGKWGMMYKSHLEKHKKVVFSILLAEGKLYQHCAEVEKQARDMFDMLVERMKVAEGVTEELKDENQMEWVQRMGNIEARVREIMYEEIIYL